jgi:Protein of unknown function (DUF1592)/Protein of unknown function (DUF1588)/Protein of unknown function (DUF1587)/Protein of unknown function (DUF1585)/Protein of unknown function (DUF1595)/Planctomycete cytochrome C
MHRRSLSLALVPVLAIAFASAARAALGPAADAVVEESFQRELRPFLTKNCFVCHNAERQAGDLNLESFAKLSSLSESREDWKLIVQRVETGEMPPSEMPAKSIPPGGLPNPPPAERQAAIHWIKSEFARADGAITPLAGRVTARRLNRVEYNNTIQDLLGIKFWPADDFPQDDASHGFDNIADSLTMSPVLMEKYLVAAERAARMAVYGPEPLHPATKKLEQVERDVLNRTEVPKEYDVTGLNTDRSLHAIHRFPVDGEYLFRVTSRGFRPLGSNPLELGLWLDGKLVTELQVDPKEDGPSLLGGRQDLFGKPQEFRMFVPAGDHWVAATVLRMFEGLPPIYKGPNPSNRNPPTEVAVQFPGQAAPEGQKPRDGAQTPGTPADAAVVSAPTPVPAPVAAAAPEAAPALPPPAPQVPRDGAAVAVVPPAAAPVVAAGVDPAAPAPAAGARGGRAGRGGRGRGNGLAPIDTQIGIDYVDIVGPYQQTKGPSPESIRKLFPRENFDRTAPRAANEVLSAFLHRAFRRPVTRAEVAKYVGLYNLVRKAGDSFEEGIAVAIQAVLVSPDFLYRIERDPPAKNPEAPIADHELATRLSYFLWSSMPDDELLAAADRGTLRKPEVLEKQIRRMLQSPKSVSLAKNFAGQWLQTRKMESVTPDFNLFPDFDAYLRMSMLQETELFFDHIVREDRSITEFLDANYSFLNERLAGFYGVPGVKGTEFRKVELKDTPRGGIITQASVLTVSSYATRTSPVLRGKWILDNILNAPPPAPPDNVPALEDTIKGNPEASLREQLAMHRKNPTCAGCHSRMDPLGVGLENFNAIGAWRTLDGKLPIDASGKLPDGRSFSGPTDLRGILTADRKEFAACLAEKMLIYALGRGLEAHDRPTVKELTSRLEKNDYRFSALVIEIVNSLPFQKRTREKS